ncbi:putative deacetylvindoline O-acetyltransferase [Helianthus annuus]|uniref:Deacetylvindoline O-acetyltransferase n=2 Tax=Helianthus annuus TaxID=4232 RepID=A0A251V150_HELAN|nr:putative deacetylvindoline O-acetyltransferase [Helianthus annuus]KAJ0580353.1 putative deacetylvindoline O-acetyltransferase [Helianthus annuus]KAJ0596301.1 putative deacetylvindoline O-acetyltransferase [Helianthus annuus]KAJ0926012.1 putative deacetylvindoline O-acetyltransferase [Helianthus annuus]KAJ0930500.1 putative deacetylvindoline O-acetyltransferase [Helianthus annuus]
MYAYLHLTMLAIYTMNMFMAKRFGRIRQLHTIISQETIKPSSPTPLHLKTHNLSLLDQFAPRFLMPKVFFYKHYNNGNTSILKKSLSNCLTQYYPFAGRFPPSSTSYVDCNDEGIAFIEAANDSRIEDFVTNRNQDETLDQLLPNNKVGPDSLIKVQVNYFAGGGAAIAVAISHKIADGYAAASFINHWAIVTRGLSPTNPNFISSTNVETLKIPEVMNKGTYKGNFIARRFIFSNSKLRELKERVLTMGAMPSNPTRVELLTCLLFKCVARASAMKSGDFKPALLAHCVNMRKKIIKNSPEAATGNVMTLLATKIASSSEIMLHEVVAELQKEKLKLDGLRNEQEVAQHHLNTLTMLGDEESESFISSSLCRFPFYGVDFGWGNPVKVVTRYPDVDDNGVIFLDAPNGDGIEALVHLQKEEMPIFEKDEELLAYIEDW